MAARKAGDADTVHAPVEAHREEPARALDQRQHPGHAPPMCPRVEVGRRPFRGRGRELLGLEEWPPTRAQSSVLARQLIIAF